MSMITEDYEGYWVFLCADNNGYLVSTFTWTEKAIRARFPDWAPVDMFRSWAAALRAADELNKASA